MTSKTFSGRFIETLDAELADVARKHPYRGGSQTEVLQSLTAYRDILGRNRNRIREVHNNGGSGTVVCSLLSEVIDRLIIHISNELEICESETHCFAVIALGGYGRNELNPYSDVDLLFLFRENTGDLLENKISDMIHFLWDMNLDIGHSTRTLGECVEAAKEDKNLATSFLEARFLTGNEKIREEFRNIYADWLRNRKGIDLSMEKIEERNSRLKYFHGTVKLQEPNVKESPGALRDIHAARWLLMLSGLGKTIKDLYDSGFLYDYEITAYEEDFDFFLRVRNALHFTAGKKYDLLEHLNLPVIAKNLNYSGTKQKATEKFMREYYMRAGSVYRLTNHIVGRFLKRFGTSVIHDLKQDPSGLVTIGSKVGLPSFDDAFLRGNPVFLVKIYTFAAVHNFEITGYATSVIERNIHNLDENFPLNPAVTAEFHELINMRKGLGSAFRHMHEHGVLTKLIPEFGNISWHYQYNFYHAYTTDEHSIRVVENLEKMASGSLSKIPELSEIMADVTAKGALYLAGLLHDIGKGKGKGHSLRSERMATKALERLNFDERTIELVRFLIREHLTMSHISQRRDMDDEDIINDFIRRVHSTGRLRMLTLLTFADLMSLSEVVLTDWKKSLLLRLYNKTMMCLEKGYEEPVTQSGKHIIEKVLRGKRESLPEQTLRNHLKKLPKQYLRVTGPSSIRSHIRGIESMEKQGVWASFHHMSDVTLLTVITRDYPKALSDICGTITSSDINIIGAQIFTRNDGIIIDMFLVVDAQGDSLIDRETQKAFKQNLSDVISGAVTVSELIKTHIHRWKRRKRKVIFSPPRVGIHNDISSSYTVIDVFAIDYTGFLYDVSSVLASYNIDIHTAKIGTDEDQIADAFYVRKSGGGKIEDKEILKKITGTLIETLSKAYKDKFKI